MKKWLFNPFIYIAGMPALLIGWAIMLVSAFICYHSNTHFDGVLDAHTSGHIAPMYAYFIELLVDWGCVVLLFYIGGKLFSHSAIRFIDVAGTLALARWVMIFPAILGFYITVPGTTHSIDALVKSITPGIVLLGLLDVVFAIWMVALMYNAFTISCNLKGGKATGIFISVLLIAEVISKVILHLLYNHIAK